MLTICTSQRKLTQVNSDDQVSVWYSRISAESSSQLDASGEQIKSESRRQRVYWEFEILTFNDLCPERQRVPEWSGVQNVNGVWGGMGTGERGMRISSKQPLKSRGM